MSSKIYITEETVRQARSTAELPLLEERIVTLIRYRLRMIEITADGATAGTYRKEIKTLVKAANIIFGPGHGKRLKARAKEQPPYFEQDGGQAGTSHSAKAVLKPHGGWAGTSVTISGREAGTSDGAKGGTLPPKERKQSPWPRGPKAGTSAYTYGREAGVFVEHLPHEVAEGWKAGRHGSRDGAGAGTPLQQAAAKHSDGAGAGTLDINWTPFDDFAVGGTNDEMERKQGKYLAKLIAKKRGR